MSLFDELEHCLQGHYGPDFWSDYYIDEVQELLCHLDEAGWARLAHVWPERPVRYQARLAQALFSLDSPHTLPLLEQLLASQERAVALAAAESLECTHPVWVPSAGLRPVLERLLRRLRPAERTEVESLLARLPA